MSLILNSNQGLALFRQTQILRSTTHKNLQKQVNEDFIIQLFHAWLHFNNNKFPNSMHIEQTLINSSLEIHSLNWAFNSPYFYCIPPENITDKFTIIKDICKFPQTAFISSMRCAENLFLYYGFNLEWLDTHA